MNFLKNFPGFYFKSVLCVFQYVSMNFSHWQNLCDTQNLVRSLHRHRGMHLNVLHSYSQWDDRVYPDVADDDDHERKEEDLAVDQGVVHAVPRVGRHP